MKEDSSVCCLGFVFVFTIAIPVSLHYLERIPGWGNHTTSTFSIPGPLYSLQLILNSSNSPRQTYQVQILCTAFHSLLHSQDQQQVVFSRKFNRVVTESARTYIFHILFRFYTKRDYFFISS